MLMKNLKNQEKSLTKSYSNLRYSTKTKSTVEHTKAKPKILKVTVIDIKSEVPSDFEMNSDIAEITSE